MHRITDNRVSSVLLENLQLFKDACGLSKMPRAVLVTTMWKLESEAVGEGREKELKEIFWKDLIEMGSKVERFEDTSESARRIAFGSSDDQGEVGTVTITTGIVNEHGKVIESDFTRDTINQKAEKEGNKKMKDVGRHKGSPALSKRSLDTSKLPTDDDNVHGENWLCIPRLI
ncbi:hypothetical protein FRB91_008599 [Serendipita sp. 411]|nr:hypothetical protein FRC20_001490 [Serendipita sp. 405]KAG8859232.1 hypothetical protein FRB91_008599 [Serendipita sp. 411]